jgi:hypothetical protein
MVHDILSNNHIELVESIVEDETDLLLFYIAMMSMKISGHRYGTFLNAASTAAKLAVYTTYLEHGKNQRKTGFLHHIENKRVKSIIAEVEAALTEDQTMDFLGPGEPQYLIGVPHLWMELYPYTGAQRSCLDSLSPRDIKYLEKILPKNIPNALLLSDAEFINVIEQMHERCQAHAPPSSQTKLSEAMIEHIKFCLIDSATVGEIKPVETNVPLFALMKSSYSPKSYSSRIEVMFRDTLRVFNLLRLWVNKDPQVFRALETLEIDSDKYPQAIAELDEFIQNWADRYHTDAQSSIVLQLVVGPRTSRAEF